MATALLLALSFRMESDSDIRLIARAMLLSYGDRTATVLEQRIAGYSAVRNSEMASFWSRVAQAAREMQAGQPLA
jgi:hypothetical protein